MSRSTIRTLSRVFNKREPVETGSAYLVNHHNMRKQIVARVTLTEGRDGGRRLTISDIEPWLDVTEVQVNFQPEAQVPDTVFLPGDDGQVIEVVPRARG